MGWEIAWEGTILLVIILVGPSSPPPALDLFSLSLSCSRSLTYTASSLRRAILACFSALSRSRACFSSRISEFSRPLPAPRPGPCRGVGAADCRAPSALSGWVVIERVGGGSWPWTGARARAGTDAGAGADRGVDADAAADAERAPARGASRAVEAPAACDREGVPGPGGGTLPRP